MNEMTCGNSAVAPKPLTAEEVRASKVITPTVGRKVWYRPSKFDATGPIPMIFYTGQPLDATVIAVHGDSMVNVLIHDVYGKPFPKTSVKLLQPGDEPELDAEGIALYGYVEWMPFQVGK